ncbi:hypothetical protein CKO51_05785 [Rhodopirellula sp. SM50]|nr:hypothetical protein [Rhodopirellula sp. SM50]PAY20555.1 hypothetical protein CKO51_05785 [Rhodopirellula sp. SM50]
MPADEEKAGQIHHGRFAELAFERRLDHSLQSVPLLWPMIAPAQVSQVTTDVDVGLGASP